MKLLQEHFNLFKSECEKQLIRFGLHSWQVYFQMKQLNDSFARTQWKYSFTVPTIFLSNYFF